MASGAVTVGGLVINLSAETSQLKTDMAQNVRTVDTSAKAISTSMSGIATSTRQANDAGSRLVQQLKSELAAFGTTGQGVNQYRASINGLGGDLQSHQQAVKGATQAKEEESAATSKLAGVIQTLAAAYAALKVGEYVKDATLLAARYETLGVVMNNVGKNAGYTQSAMAGFEKGLEATGISMIQSRESLAAMAQAHIDLSQSMKLARVAQDAAVIGGISSSEAFQRMTVGLQQGDVEIMRNLGLNVDFQSAYALTAATLHKHVDLLTTSEKMQAGVNAVMAVAADIAGSYETAMSTAGKQLSSMSRYAEDLKVKLGGVFLGAFTKQIELQTLAFKSLGVAMDESLEGGTLATFAVNAGEAAAKTAAAVIALVGFVHQHAEAIEDLVAVYAIYQVANSKAVAELVKNTAATVSSITATWSAAAATLAAAKADATGATAALARAQSSNAVAVAAVEEAAATLSATTSVQGQFIATEALTAAQATLAVTTESVVVASAAAAAASGELALAEVAASAGTVAMTTAVGALDVALGILLSPLTLVVAAIGLAVVAYNHFRSEADKKVENHLPSYADTTEQLRQLNDEQKYGTGVLGENAKQIEAVTIKIKQLNLEKEAKTAAMGSSESQYTKQLKAEVGGITEQVNKLAAQLGLLEKIRAKLGGADARKDVGSPDALNALVGKYTLPPPRKQDVMATVAPAINDAVTRVENTTYAGNTDEERAAAKAQALQGVYQKASNALLGIEFQFASETNTANKNAEVAAQNHATVLSAINAKALSDAKAAYDMRLITQEDYANKENAYNQQEAAAALKVANEKIRVAQMTVTNDPVSKAQAVSQAIAERDALVNKNAEQSAQGRIAAAQAAIEAYNREFGSISGLNDQVDELNTNTRLNYQVAGKTAEQQAMFSAQYTMSRAKQLSDDMAAREENNTATDEYRRNTSAMIGALNLMGEAKLKAIAPGVQAQFLNDAKQMRDETVSLYADMANTYVDTDEERIRSAAATSIRLAAIRLADAKASIDSPDNTDSDADKLKKKQKLLADYSNYVDAVNQNADAKVMQSSAGFKELVSIMSNAFDTTRVEQFGSAMQSAFGNAGGAIGGMVDAMNNYGLQQKALMDAQAQANTLYANDQAKLGAATDAINREQTKSTLDYYSNIAGAAKGFFNENSKGYKVLQDVQMAFHAVETALAIESAIKKIAGITAVTTAEVASAGTKVAVQAGATATSVGLAGTEASAWGVTAVVKAIASMPFPLNLAAGAATLAAIVGLGVKLIGGLSGSGQSTSQERQAAQGTGTVLGDSSAKSNSIAKSIELTASNSSTQINYLSGLLTTLKSIETGISDFAAELVKTTDVANPNVSLNKNNGLATTIGSAGVTAGGAALGYAAGAGLTAFTELGAIGGPLGMVAGALIGAVISKIPAIGNLMTSIFGGKQSVDDSGFSIAKESVGDIDKWGAVPYSYADVRTSGGWFSGDDVDPQYSKLTADANNQVTNVIKSLHDSIEQAGTLLGASGDDFTAKLNGFVVDIGKVSLKGLSADDQQKALEAVFSKLGDQMAQAAIPDLAQFQQVGEGYLQTLVRVASDYAKVDASLQSINVTFGKTGVASIGARESLVALLGGIDDFQSKTADYAQNFLTKAQQLAPVQAFVTGQLQSMGLAWIKTRDDFAKEIASLSGNLSDSGAQQTYAALMNLEAAFASVTPAIVDTTKSLQDIADEQKDLQDQYDQLTMTQAQLALKARNAISSQNLALYDQVQAATAAKNAVDATKTSLGNLASQLKSFATTAAGLNSGLLTGDLSTLTPEQQLAQARQQYGQTYLSAMGGDASAQGQLQSVEQTFLKLSQQVNGGDAQYSADLAKVMQDNDRISDWATSAANDAQKQLDVLNSIDGEAAAIHAAMSKMVSGTAGGMVRPSVDAVSAAVSSSVPRIANRAAAVSPIDYSTMGTSDKSALVNAVKDLQATVVSMAAEIKGLRAEALQRTGSEIGAVGAVGQQVTQAVSDVGTAVKSLKKPESVID